MSEIKIRNDEPGHFILSGLGMCDIGMEYSVARELYKALRREIEGEPDVFELDLRGIDRLYVRGYIHASVAVKARRRAVANINKALKPASAPSDE